MAFGMVQGLVNAFRTRGVNRRLDDLLSKDPRYAQNPYAAQNLGITQQMFGGRMPGAEAAQQGLMQSQNNAVSAAGRGATDASQLLGVGSGAQGATNAGIVNLTGQEGQYKTGLLGHLQNAYNTMISEGDKVHQDQVRRFSDLSQIRSAQEQNKTNAIGGVFKGLDSDINQAAQIAGMFLNPMGAVGGMVGNKTTANPSVQQTYPQSGTYGNFFKHGVLTGSKVKDNNWVLTKDLKGEPSHEEGGTDIDVQGKTAEAEGNELVLKNKSGQTAVIPKNNRSQALNLLKQGNQLGMSKMISKLPKSPDKAADGGVYDNNEDGNKNTSKITPPQNYKPLDTNQRSDWNNFLDFLDKKGIAGSKDLDIKDKSLGLSYLAQYQKENPKTNITPDMIQNVQYEQQQLRKGDKFGNFTPQELKEWQAKNSDFINKQPLSDVDGWLGSKTSKLYYPRGSQVYSDNRPKKDFGTDIENYFRATKSK